MKKKTKLSTAQQKALDYLAGHTNPLLQKAARNLKGGIDPIVNRPPIGRWEPPATDM
jgi:hypothetical protein